MGYLQPCIFWSPHCAKPPENRARAGAGLAPGDPGHPLLWLQAQAYSLYSQTGSKVLKTALTAMCGLDA